MEILSDGKTYKGVIPFDYITPEWDILYYFEIIDIFDYGIIYPEFLDAKPYYITEVQE